MSSSPSKAEILSGYRQLHRWLLRAVMYASPARHTARDQLRAAFREKGAKWDGEGVVRTICFLRAAARERGLEHRIVKNLLRVRGEEARKGREWRWVRTEERMKASDPLRAKKDLAFRHYNMTIAMLNKSMGLCLR